MIVQKVMNITQLESFEENERIAAALIPAVGLLYG